MIKPSDRLNSIAEYINFEEDIADIGTDHGYLPLYLLEQNPERKVIFTDVNEGPLVKTRNMIIKEHGNSDIGSFDIRLGDGLVPVKSKEVDVIVIAGMGGILIKNILQADLQKTRSFKKMILQPRTAACRLRKWLVSEGIFIYDETLAYENKRICEIIAVNPNPNAYQRNTEFRENLDYEFSPILLKKNTPIVREWIDNLLKKEEAIEKSITHGGTEESQKKLDSIVKRINKLSEIRENFYLSLSNRKRS